MLYPTELRAPTSPILARRNLPFALGPVPDGAAGPRRRLRLESGRRQQARAGCSAPEGCRPRPALSGAGRERRWGRTAPQAYAPRRGPSQLKVGGLKAFVHGLDQVGADVNHHEPRELERPRWSPGSTDRRRERSRVRTGRSGPRRSRDPARAEPAPRPRRRPPTPRPPVVGCADKGGPRTQFELLIRPGVDESQNLGQTRVQHRIVQKQAPKGLLFLVGARGFEPPTT